MLRRWAAELEQKHRCERVELARAHFGEVRVIEREAGDAYQSGMAGSEARAARAASEGPWHGARHYADLSGDGHALRNVRAYEELEQVREVEGEAAYQRLRQSFESLRQSPLPSKRPTPRGPERGGGIER